MMLQSAERNISREFEFDPGDSSSAGLDILHIVAPGAFGGLERVVQSLAAGQVQAGHGVQVIAVVPERAREVPFIEELRRSDVPVTPIAVRSRAYLEEMRRLGEEIDRIQPEIVHTHGYRPDVLAARPARQSGAKRVSTLHGFTGGDLKNRLYELLQLRALRQYDAVVAVARAQLGRIVSAGVSVDRVHLVQNGWVEGSRLDRRLARAELGLPDSEFHVGWAGRLSREKGADVLLEALSRVEDLPLTVSVLGDGRERASLEAQASRLGVSDRVRWHGAVPNAARLFAAFDAFVLSSRTEGTPIVLFEAMSTRVPVVATAVGGVPDVVGSHEAVLVPAEDPESLAAGLRFTFLDRQAATERVSRASRRLETDFGVANWLTRYDLLYRRLLNPLGV